MLKNKENGKFCAILVLSIVRAHTRPPTPRAVQGFGHVWRRRLASAEAYSHARVLTHAGTHSNARARCARCARSCVVVRVRACHTRSLSFSCSSCSADARTHHCTFAPQQLLHLRGRARDEV
eukprot:2477022-Pleurochrysis_carterae.AAC.3